MEMLSLFNLAITVCLTIGGLIAYHQGFARTVSEVQERVINALKSELQTLHDRIAALEKENTRLNYTITTICTSLKQRGIHVTIDGDIVTIHDYADGSHTYNTHIQNVDDAAGKEEYSTHTTRSTTTATKKRRRQPFTSIPLTNVEEQ